MPKHWDTKTGRLTRDGRRLVERKLNNRKGCPECGHPDTRLISSIFSLDLFKDDFDKSMPLVAVGCPMCSNVRFFSGIEMGLRSEG